MPENKHVIVAACLKELNLVPLKYAKRVLAHLGVPVPRMLYGAPVLTHVDLYKSMLTEPHIFRWMVELLRPGDVCFDVGAHHGWMSMVAARKVGSTGKVFAFEPSPALVNYLRYIKRVNRLSQLEIVPKAVADRNDLRIPFRLVGDGNSCMNALLELRVPEDSTRTSSVLEIETITLDAFSEMSGTIPNLIKIDTEGAEVLVSRGATRLIEMYRPALIVASHPLWVPDDQNIEELFRFLKDCGYRLAESQLTEYGGTQFGDYLFVTDRSVSSH